MQFYTYAHYRPNGEIFYIGKGQGMRYKSVASGRSQHWHAAAKDGFDPVILAHWPSEDEALEHEAFLILCFAGKLANRTTGGQRGQHAPITEETRQRMIAAQRRINERRLTDPEWDKRIGEARRKAGKASPPGTQIKAAKTFREKFATNPEFAKKISMNRAKAQQASAAQTRMKSLHKAMQVLAMRADGKKYSDIMKAVGCSIGFVSKVMNNAKIS